MESAGAVNKEFIELAKLVTSDNEQLLTHSHTVEQSQKLCLRRSHTVLGLNITERLIELVKHNSTFLLNALNVRCDAGDICINNQQGISCVDCLNGKELCEQRLTNAFVTAEDNAEIAIKCLEGLEYLLALCVVDAVDFGLFDFKRRRYFEEEATLLAESNIVDLCRQLLIGLQRVAVDSENITLTDCSHIYSPSILLSCFGIVPI